MRRSIMDEIFLFSQHLSFWPLILSKALGNSVLICPWLKIQQQNYYYYPVEQLLLNLNDGIWPFAKSCKQQLSNSLDGGLSLYSVQNQKYKHNS